LLLPKRRKTPPVSERRTKKDHKWSLWEPRRKAKKKKNVLSSQQKWGEKKKLSPVKSHHKNTAILRKEVNSHGCERKTT